MKKENRYASVAQQIELAKKTARRWDKCHRPRVEHKPSRQALRAAARAKAAEY